MGILLCEQKFRDVWSRNESVRAEIGQIVHTDTRGKISSKGNINSQLGKHDDITYSFYIQNAFCKFRDSDRPHRSVSDSQCIAIVLKLAIQK